MKLLYHLSIDKPENHNVKMTIEGIWPKVADNLEFFMPCWSPGSYLMREYSRNILYFKVTDERGRTYSYEQVSKNTWNVTKNKDSGEKFKVEYLVYCNELSVRTSLVNINHAFIHGPSVFMGVNSYDVIPELKINFPALWSKVSTGLEEIDTGKRDEFLYKADNFDQFIDAPIEIGCHETDGFRVEGKDHHLAFYGATLPNEYDIKGDIKKIVETISKTMGDIPYEKYLFLTHFIPNQFGGLEHLNSTALIYCPYRFATKEGYKDWLELVAHEYFHTWNVKRIRPIELGPFDYSNENYTSMHWLTEGLTSFMDKLFVYRSGLVSLEEYLEGLKNDFTRYLDNHGKKFHSLEASSYNAWIKLYRADENYNNSSISYYLKGGIVFFVLNVLLNEKDKSLNDLLDLLWKRYKDNPSVGVTKEEVYQMIKDLGTEEVLNKFDTYITTTEDIDLVTYLDKMGLAAEFSEEDKNLSEFEMLTEEKNGNLFIKSVQLDGPAYRYGLNAGDEIVAINGLRANADTFKNFDKTLRPNTMYQFMISRQDSLQNIEVLSGHKKKVLKTIVIKDQAKAEKVLSPLIK